jgi:hypothetical protein
MQMIPMHLDIPEGLRFADASNIAKTNEGASSAAAASSSCNTFDFAHILNTSDLIDYSSSSHIRKRGHVPKVCAVARYFPLVPPPDYTPPGNAMKSIHQQVALRLAFLRNMSPSRDEFIQLSAKTGLPWTEIATWFKGERWRIRKSGGLVTTMGGKQPSLNAWSLIMEGINMDTTPSTAMNKHPQPPKTAAMSAAAAEESRRKHMASLRSKLTKTQLKRSREWAVRYTIYIISTYMPTQSASFACVSSSATLMGGRQQRRCMEQR